MYFFFFFQAEDGIRDGTVTGVQTCALPISHAEARLTKGVGGLTGQGTARRNPEDREATQIGEEIAAARALSDLAHKLLHAAAGDIEAITHQEAHLHL